MTITGILVLHTETGTEGGYWAIQDEKHIKHNVPRGYCRKCGKWLRPQSGNLQVTRILPLTTENPPPFCPSDEHEEEISDAWDYEGLHVLTNGDHLTILEQGQVVWEGTIHLHEYPVFQESALGFWIHADQIGIDRERWAKWFLGWHQGVLRRDENHSHR